MLERLNRLHPFQSPDARRLAVLFGVVYFAQGMWYLPNQTITIVLKERGLSAGEVATFFSISTIPWLIKPLYGLISDFVPLFGRRRKSYLLLSSALAAAAGLTLGLGVEHTYWWLAGLFTVMGLGLAFTDVLVDALMVENGKLRGLTGAFQAVQWGAIYAAAIAVGEAGGYLAERRRLSAGFLLAASFALVSFLMALGFVREVPTRVDREVLGTTVAAITNALREREVWVVAGFIFFWTFSPSFGPALLYYQTDVLKFSQQFIGHLTALESVAGIVGAFIYAPLSRALPLKRLINLSIGIGVVSTLAYLLYRDAWSAVLIDTVFGCAGMITQLALLDLAAKACPRLVEATFFALLTSVYNAGNQGSQVVGGHLYDWLGYTPLVLVSTAFTALGWLLVPLVKIDRIDARAAASREPTGG
ncbi:MAG TPA: MFS transporter [Methylomirabilota bacterium]|jgi:MFS family permease|nr:MFS transporter [Methylomirabilota bacterium]